MKGPAPPPGRKPAVEAFKPQAPVRPHEAKTTPASPPSATKNLVTAAQTPATPAIPVVINKPTKPEEKKPALIGKNVLKISWQQGSRGEYQLDVGEIQSLEQLDSRLRRQEASLVGKKFEYLCRGIVVAKAFWDIFRPEHLFPTLYIQEETGDAARNRVKAAIPGSSGEKKSGFVAPSTGFAAPSKVTFQKPVVKVAQAPATAAAAAAAGSSGAAKVGFKADDAWFAARPALFAGTVY